MKGPIISKHHTCSINLGPEEQTNVMMKANWVRNVVMKMLYDFRSSLKEHPPIPPADPYSPQTTIINAFSRISSIRMGILS